MQWLSLYAGVEGNLSHALRKKFACRQLKGSGWEFLMRRELLARVRWKRYAPGWYLYGRLSPMTHLQLLVQGKVRVTADKDETGLVWQSRSIRNSYEGNSWVGFRDPYVMLGISDMFGMKNERLTYRAVTPCVCLTLPIHWLRAEHADQPQLRELVDMLFWRIMQMQTQQNAWLLDQFRIQQGESMDRKLARFILDSGCNTFPIRSFTQMPYQMTVSGAPRVRTLETLESVASMLGCGFRHLMRMVGDFCSCGCLEKVGSGYEVCNPELLKALADAECQLKDLLMPVDKSEEK